MKIVVLAGGISTERDVSLSSGTGIYKALKEKGHQAILDWLSQKGSISNADIQKNFGVSYDSAKRDLRILEEKGFLKRTHGGALPLRRLLPADLPR